MSSDKRFRTRRKVLAASGSAAMLGLAGCLGGDDDPQGGGNGDDTDGSGTGTEADTETVALVVEGVGGGHDHDDDSDGDHDDDHDDDHHDDEHGHDYHHDGLTASEIDHACGHMDFDERAPLEGGATAEEAPVIDTVHEPFDVNFAGSSGYVKFVVDGDDDHDDDHDDHDDGHDEHDEDHDDHDDDHDDHGGGMFGFFTEFGTAEVVTGELVYAETADVEGCDAIDRYIIVEPDHGEAVVELSPGL